MWRNRIILILCIIAAGVLTSTYGGQISYSIFYFTLAVPVISLLYTLIVYSRFRFLQKIAQTTLVKEEPADYLFQLGNEDFITYAGIGVRFYKEYSLIQGEEGSNPEKEYCLFPGEKASINTKLTCRYRGKYEVGIYAVTIKDFLSIWKITYPIRSRLEVTVLPRKIALEAKKLSLSNEDEKNRNQYGRGNEEPDIEVHKYMAGESMKKINWKASARKRELLSRNYRNEEKKQLRVVLDFSGIEGAQARRIQIEDAIIEQTIAVAHYCLLNRLACSVIYLDNHANPSEFFIRNAEEFEIFYHRCAVLESSQEKTTHGLLEYAMGTKLEDGYYILILHSMDRNEFESIAQYTKRGFAVRVILILDKPTEEEKNRIRALKDIGVRMISYRTQEEDDHGKEK